MELIVKEAFPLKSFAYIERHFAYIDDLRGECAENGLPQQRQKSLLLLLLQFAQMFTFLGLQSLEFALVYFFYNNFTPLEMVLLGRYIEMSSLKRETYFPAIGVLALSAYFLHLLYFDRSHGLERLLVAVLVEQRWEVVFMSERTIQGQQPVCAYMRRYTMNWIALFQLFFLVIDLFVLFSQLYEVHLLLMHLKTETSLVKVGYLLLLELRLTVLYLALFTFARSHLLVGTFYIVTVKLFLLKLEQVETYISEIGRQQQPNDDGALKERRKSSITNHNNKLKSILLANYLQLSLAQEHYITTLKMITRMNSFFGKSFFAFLAATIPLNCLLVSSLIFSHVPPFAALFVVTIALQESACHLFIHLLVAHLNKRILAPVQTFLRVHYRRGKFLHTTKHKLKCAHFIEAFWCRKQYGLTYYKFGKISMFSFFKYILLYMQLLMWIGQNG